MCVRRNNNRLFLAIVLGMFLASGCSGHSVKYGANSEGEGLVAEKEKTGMGNGVSSATTQHAKGSILDGGTVNGTFPFRNSELGSSEISGGEISEEMVVESSTSSVPWNGSEYGRQFGGVDGSGPNHGPVTGFGSGSANNSNPSPEAWANVYLRKKRSSQDFYGDPSGSVPGSNGTSSSASQSGGNSPSGSSYGHNYSGVPGSGQNFGAVDGFSQNSASTVEVDPEAWAQAYLKEKGGVPPELVNSDTDIAQDMGMDQSNGEKSSGPNGRGLIGSSAELLEISNSKGLAQSQVQDIYFSFDSWSISREAAKYLEEDAQWLQANPQKGLTIEGHCDQRGTQDYNLVLGKKRAEAAREFLVNLGVAPDRINIVSYGKERPFCKNTNENCFQENRRNHMVVRMNQS